MDLLKVKTIGKYKKLSIILSLVLLISTSSNAYSEEPLGTIGEPPTSDINSPFGLKIKQNTPADINSESPFNTDTPDTTIETMQQVSPEEGQPKIEQLQQTEQMQSLIADPNNPLGLAYPYQQLEISKDHLKKKETAQAKLIVEPLSEWLTTLTEYHIELFKKLNNIETAKNQAQIEKRIALDAALLRDKAYYQLALIYLTEHKEKEAIKYLVEVIKSQPKTELGMKSYEILQQIGFTDKIRLVQ